MNEKLLNGRMFLTFVGRLSCRKLPKNDAKREDVRFYGMLLILDDFRGHPLICTNFALLEMTLELIPSEIADLWSKSIIDHDIQT